MYVKPENACVCALHVMTDYEHTTMWQCFRLRKQKASCDNWAQTLDFWLPLCLARADVLSRLHFDLKAVPQTIFQISFGQSRNSSVNTFCSSVAKTVILSMASASANWDNNNVGEREWSTELLQTDGGPAPRACPARWLPPPQVSFSGRRPR